MPLKCHWGKTFSVRRRILQDVFESGIKAARLIQQDYNKK